LIAEWTLSYADAKNMVEAISAEVARRGKAAVIVVADAHGELLALARMDGAPLSSLAIATNKAWSAARERKPSKDIGTAARDRDKGFDIGYFGDPKFTGWGGGVPVWKEGKVVGAVAVSGLPQAEDIELATAAAEQIAASSHS
jgi:glc operon protein GlcG